MKRPPRRVALYSVLLGAILAVVEGFDNLACAGRPDILITIAGSFGAGASLVALLKDDRERSET